MQRDRVAALVIILLMVFSIAGFAASSFPLTGNTVNEPQQQQSIPTVSNRFLTGEELSFLIRSGRVVLESVYNKNCSECRTKDQELRNFALKYSGFLFMESVETDSGEGWEKLQMIGSNGEIFDLKDKDITEQYVFDKFCEIGAVKPRSCFAKTYEQFLNQRPPTANETINQSG